MPRILIVGGYGTFGIRIARRLARVPDLEIIITGRSAAKAEAAAREVQRGAVALVTSSTFDSATATVEDLINWCPAVVVNASGPFQGQDYGLAEVCIRAKCHYVDIADARDYVCGIRALDDSARTAGVTIVSGASSVPGVSSAVVRHFECAFTSLEVLEIAISPGSGFEPGPATVSAGLSYLGQPINVRTSGEHSIVYGWQGLRRTEFLDIGKRWTAYCDVPDLDLFPQRYPSMTTVRFYAGLEIGIMTFALWCLSWPARIGVLKNSKSLTLVLSKLRAPLSWLGQNRGAMSVRIEGISTSFQPHAVVWGLSASNGDGLYVPTLATVILARKLALADTLPRGAFPCFGLVSLEEIENELADLRIKTGVRAPLYKRILGKQFTRLPAAVARLHDTVTDRVWRGACQVEHGPSLLAKLAALLVPFPRKTQGLEEGFEFRILVEEGTEIWKRQFPGGTVWRQEFLSRQFESGGKLHETVRGARFVFAIEASEMGQRLVLERFSLFGVPLPRGLYPQIDTLETEHNGRYHFKVEVRLPTGGLLVRYEGWLVEGSDRSPP